MHGSCVFLSRVPCLLGSGHRRERSSLKTAVKLFLSALEESVGVKGNFVSNLNETGVAGLGPASKQKDLS